MLSTRSTSSRSVMRKFLPELGGQPQKDCGVQLRHGQGVRCLERGAPRYFGLPQKSLGELLVSDIVTR